MRLLSPVEYPANRPARRWVFDVLVTVLAITGQDEPQTTQTLATRKQGLVLVLVWIELLDLGQLVLEQVQLSLTRTCQLSQALQL